MHRTYVRRRVVAVTLGLLLLGWVVPAAAGAVTSDPPPSASGTYVVLPGDTLWDIAERTAPGEDPRVVVARIAAANGIEPGNLEPGRALILAPA